MNLLTSVVQTQTVQPLYCSGKVPCMSVRSGHVGLIHVGVPLLTLLHSVKYKLNRDVPN